MARGLYRLFFLFFEGISLTNETFSLILGVGLYSGEDKKASF
jgi:hypothetical protein